MTVVARILFIAAVGGDTTIVTAAPVVHEGAAVVSAVDHIVVITVVRSVMFVCPCGVCMSAGHP